MMRLGRSRSKVALALERSVLCPTDSVTATITIGEPIDRVRSATVELGYVNTYSYRWAGRRDAALRHDDASLLTLGDAGTDAGSERDTHDWVAALAEALPVNGGVLEAGRHDVVLRIPSWAPGSSQSIVRWVVRVRVDREGRVAVFLQRERASHPLARTPGGGSTFDGRRVQLDKHLTLAPGVPATLPFEIDVPADADPTSEAVHSSLTWFVQARVLYKGFNSHGPERVRRELVICTTD